MPGWVGEARAVAVFGRDDARTGVVAPPLDANISLVEGTPGERGPPARPHTPPDATKDRLRRRDMDPFQGGYSA